MARLTRHQLRTDELESRLTAFSAFFVQHRKRLIWSGAAALPAAAIVLGVVFYIRGQQAKAGDAFAKALETFHAPVTPTPPPGLTVPTFKSPEEKYTQALQQFQEVAGQYARYTPGHLSRYYAALCLQGLGKQSEAEKEFRSIAQQESAELAALAKLSLAGMDQQRGRVEEAEKQYRELEKNPASTVPKPTVQIALADLLRGKNPQQALEIYKQIARDYPDTAAGEVATKRVDELAQ